MRIFRPSGIPWFEQVASSIERLFREIMPAPLRLKDYATADLPAAADHAQGVVYDSTGGTLKLSDGAAWVEYLPTTSYTAADVLAKLLTVDGAGSGLDADTLDGNSSAAFAAAVHTHGTAGIDDDAVTNAKLANMAAASVKGRASGAGTGDPTDLTGTQVRAICGLATTDGVTFATVTSTGLVKAGGVIHTTGSTSIDATAAGGEFYYGGDSRVALQAYNRGTATYLPLDIRGSEVTLRNGNTVKVTVSSGGIDVVGESRCDTLRIDATPTAAAVAQTHHVPISINGITYKLLLAS